MAKKKRITRKKAKKILKHGTVRGKKLTKRQRGFLLDSSWLKTMKSRRRHGLRSGIRHGWCTRKIRC